MLLTIVTAPTVAICKASPKGNLVKVSHSLWWCGQKAKPWHWEGREKVGWPGQGSGTGPGSLEHILATILPQLAPIRTTQICTNNFAEGLPLAWGRPQTYAGYNAGQLP